MHTVRELPRLAADSVTKPFLEASNHKGKGRVPWAELQRAQGDYIKPKYLPKQVTLKQYYHLCKENVNAMLEHWMWRQAAGKVPFHFRKGLEAILQTKRTSEENDADADMGPCDKDEENLQDNNGSQVWGNGASLGDCGGSCSTEQAYPGQCLGSAAENSSKVGCS